MATAPDAELEGRSLATALLAPVIEAARIQLRYFRDCTAVVTKADKSPVTVADQESETVLIAALARIAPTIPVVAEENMASGARPVTGSAFFLVDPLDGTREFIAGRPEFTINIALVRDGRPVFGLIYTPAAGELYVTTGPGAAVGTHLDAASSPPGSLNQLQLKPLAARLPPADGLIVATSHSHMNKATEDILSGYVIKSRMPMGSSVKFCRIAEGRADIYPRVGPTSEWDTAAGQAILEAAGGSVSTLDGKPLTYGHAAGGFKNPAFIAYGRRPA